MGGSFHDRMHVWMRHLTSMLRPQHYLQSFPIFPTTTLIFLDKGRKKIGTRSISKIGDNCLSSTVVCVKIMRVYFDLNLSGNIVSSDIVSLCQELLHPAFYKGQAGMGPKEGD